MGLGNVCGEREALLKLTLTSLCIGHFDNLQMGKSYFTD